MFKGLRTTAVSPSSPVMAELADELSPSPVFFFS